MAELTFKSAGVSTREIDLSGPTAIKPQGIPAGIIGTALKGPAFVPITVATWKDFVAEFGGTDGKKFGPLAMNEWMKNARSGTFVRVLGVGDAAKRDSSTGQVSNAGFVAGAELPQNITTPDGGQLGINPYAYDDGAGSPAQAAVGRTYFLGALMRESYAQDGLAPAAATFGVDPATIDLTTLSVLGDRGESLRFTDEAGQSLTLWFHEGSNDISSAGSGASNDLADLEDGSNLLISIGSRSSATTTINSVPTAGRMIQFTDMAGLTLTIDFNSGGGDTAAADVGGGNITASLDITVHATQAAVAVAVHGVVAAAATLGYGMTSEESSPPDANLTVTMTDVGIPADEVDGGVVIAGEVTITGASGADQVVDGGTSFADGDALAAAIVSKISLATISAGLVASSALSVVTITNTTGGDAGNFGETGKITHELLNDVQSITITGVTTGAVNVADVATITQAITFVDSATPVANQVASRALATATRTITLGAVSTLVATDALTVTDSASTVSIIAVAASGAPVDLHTLAGDDVTIDSDHADFGTTSTQVLLVDAINTATVATTASASGDNVLLTHDLSGAAGNAGTISNSSFTDASIINPDGNLTGGVDASTVASIANDLAAVINLTAVDILASSDGVDTVTVTQMQAGAIVGSLTDGGALALATIAAAATAGADGTDFDDASPGAAGTLQAGITDTLNNFAGGGDATEGDCDHTYWSDAGLDTSAAGADAAIPIIRAVMMTPQGVHPTLLSAAADVDAGTAGVHLGAHVTAAGANVNGSQVGLVTISNTQERFTLLLNGHKSTSEHPSELRCSLDPQASDYFMNILNHDPACMEKAGHYVYAHYNVTQDVATVSGHGLSDDEGVAGTTTAAAFLVHGKTSNLTGLGAGSESPCYEDFQDRFRTAQSPWVISQIYGAKPKNLFRIHALDDGEAGSGRFKISLANILMSASGTHGTFDLHVRDIGDDDMAPRVYEKFLGLDLNPQSDRYIARVIGNQYMYYDFDKRPGSQKLVVDGIHAARSKFIRIEMDPVVNVGSAPIDAMPMGYRGYTHLNTDANETGPTGLRFLQDALTHIDSLGSPANESLLNDAVEPPVPTRVTIATGTGPKKRAQASLCWGTHFQVIDDLDEPNKNTKFDESILSYGKYFSTLRNNSQSSQPDMSVGNNWGVEDTADSTSIQDADRFNNNFFSLERIQLVSKQPTTASTKNPNVQGKVDHKQWAVAQYRRNGQLAGNIQTLEGLNVFQGADASSGNPHADVTSDGSNDFANAVTYSRFLDPQTDMVDSSTRRYMKFSFFLQGGFDGTNIFNKEKRNMTNRAAVWEMDDASQGGVDGSTIAGFRKAIDVMAEKADVDIKLLAVPGMRDEAITDHAIDAVEDRFDAMYIMDIEEKAVNNDLMIDYDLQKPSVNLTVEELAGRNLDSSFAAAYFPDVVITDPALGTNVQCPPSVAVLGAFSLNDSIAHPWFAPAGFSRGALKSVVETQVKLSRKNLDTLYESDVNPLAAFPHTPGVVVWGQKTLQQAQSALDRVNVRRLLIEIRREVRQAGNSLLFEPNREETLGRFSAAVNPILQRIQQQQGLDKFKVVIDTTTTTQADIENNTVRGKIFLQPTRTVEFISLDFVVTNAGMEV